MILKSPFENKHILILDGSIFEKEQGLGVIENIYSGLLVAPSLSLSDHVTPTQHLAEDI